MCVIFVTVLWALWTLRCWLLSDSRHFFPLFKYFDNFPPYPEKVEVKESEERRISCIVVIELVPLKRHCVSHPKGLPSILLVLILFNFVKCEFRVLLFQTLKHSAFCHLCFCLTASLAPPLFAQAAGPWTVSHQSLIFGFPYQIGCLQGLTRGFSTAFTTKPAKCHT